MDDHGHQVVHPVRVHRVVARVEQAELEREHHAVRHLNTTSLPSRARRVLTADHQSSSHSVIRPAASHLDVSVILLHIFESLEMEGEDGGESLDSHPLVGLLSAIGLFNDGPKTPQSRFSYFRNQFGISSQCKFGSVTLGKC